MLEMKAEQQGMQKDFVCFHCLSLKVQTKISSKNKGFLLIFLHEVWGVLGSLCEGLFWAWGFLGLRACSNFWVWRLFCVRFFACEIVLEFVCLFPVMFFFSMIVVVLGLFVFYL